MSLNIKIKQILSELGLNDIEIKVYLTNLELGQGYASTIAKSADLNRVTTYEALKRLSSKGFIRIRVKKNNSTKYFVPVEFSEVISKLRTKKDNIEESIKSAESIKDDFESRFRIFEDKPTVLFYEGKEGIKEVLNDSIKNNKKEILSFASVESIDNSFDKVFLDKYWKDRVSSGISTRGIVPDTDKAKKDFNKERNITELRSLRFVSEDLYKFKNEIDIYGDNVGIISLTRGNEHGVIIRSASIADSMRSVFETIWKFSNSENISGSK